MHMGKILELSDIYDATICSVEGIPLIQAKRSGRVYWEVPANARTYEVLARLREDPPVPILTFIRHLKRIRAMMLDYRSQPDDCGYGQEKRHHDQRQP
jgi:hypothetical protein